MWIALPQKKNKKPNSRRRRKIKEARGELKPTLAQLPLAACVGISPADGTGGCTPLPSAERLTSKTSDASVINVHETEPDQAQNKIAMGSTASHCSPRQDGSKETSHCRDDEPRPVAHQANLCTELGLDSEPRQLVSVESAIACKPQTDYFEPAEVGDLVFLGNGVPQEYRSFSAIVTKVAESHCTVTVLDESRRGGLGECWPGFQDVLVTSSAWRLGTRIVIEGMQSDRTKHLNGLTGTVSNHPRHGHPMFITKSSCPNIPQLVLCIIFDDREAARERSAFLEPRFIKPFEEAAEEMVKQLTETIACLPP